MSSAPRALITGLTGQDGSFLAELLLDHGYSVVGLVRPGEEDLGSSEHLRGRVEVIRGDLQEPQTLADAVGSVMPNEIYHLAAPTFVPDSWERPSETFAAIVGSTCVLLETVRDSCPAARLFVAGSAEIFGDAGESPQTERTPFRPRHPYGAAKLAGHLLIGQFRDHDGLFACSGILYNHESERRPPRFVTRKITRAAAAIRLGLQSELTLGDLSSVRDWSFAGDVMRGAWMMLQHEKAADYILASGVGHTVREWLDAAFAAVGLEPDEYVRTDPALARGPERTPPIGDPSRARSELDWAPTLDFAQLVQRMVDADLAELRN